MSNDDDIGMESNKPHNNNKIYSDLYQPKRLSELVYEGLNAKPVHL